MVNQALFDACDFTGSTLIGSGPAIIQTTFDTPSVHYFACSVGLGFHCGNLNLNVTVVVSESPEPPTVPALSPTHLLVMTTGLLGLLGLASYRRGRVRG